MYIYIYIYTYAQFVSAGAISLESINLYILKKFTLKTLS